MSFHTENINSDDNNVNIEMKEPWFFPSLSLLHDHANGHNGLPELGRSL